MSSINSFESASKDFTKSLETAQEIAFDNQRRTLIMKGDKELNVIQSDCGLAIAATTERLQKKRGHIDSLVATIAPDLVPQQIGFMMIVLAVIAVTIGGIGLIFIEKSVRFEISVSIGLMIGFGALIAFDLAKTNRSATKEKLLSELTFDDEFSFADEHPSTIYPIYSRYLKSFTVGACGIAFTPEMRLVRGGFPLAQSHIRKQDEFELGGYVSFDEISRFVSHPEVDLLAIILKPRGDTADRVMLIKNPKSMVKAFDNISTPSDFAEWLSAHASGPLVVSD
jgi:hypothetical protein